MGLLWIPALLVAANSLLIYGEGTPQNWSDWGPKIEYAPIHLETSPDIGNIWESEVEVIRERSSPAYNVAPKGKTSQSSTKQGAASRYATDGQLSSRCASTEVEHGPWWTLDLGSNHVFSSVAITNRRDCCTEDLSGAEIRIGTFADWRESPRIFNSIVSSTGLGETYYFACHGMEGQFVTIAIRGKNVSLTLCEVQVFGQPKNQSGDESWSIHQTWLSWLHGAPNVAPKGTATQSNNYNYKTKARLANDGSLTNDYAHCSHTHYDFEPWWNLDLNSGMRIFSIAITNRRDCCGFRLNGAEIRIGFSKDVRSNERCAILTSVDQGATLAVNCHGMEGRYVSVFIPRRREYLTLCEVQVFALPSEEPESSTEVPTQPPRSEQPKLKPKDEDGKKVSKSKVATVFGKQIILSKISLSSTKKNTEVKPPRDPTKCAVTEEEYEPWWRADLSKTYKIHSVALTNRDGSDLSGAEIRVGHNGSDWRNSSICGKVSSIGLGETNLFTCNLMEGKFITIVIPDKTASLALCEVQVFVQEAGESGGGPGSFGDDELQQPSHGVVNVAPRGLCSQSSYFDHNLPARLAVDGDRSARFYESSCITTLVDFGPWWRVDLLNKMRVLSVAVTNRGDCCGSRLNGAEILIGDSEERGGIHNPRCAQIVSIPDGQTFIYDCDGMEGRFVTIFIPKRSEQLTLCEVQVFAEQVEERREEMFRNVALNGAASQSSTYSSSGKAGNANDGSLAANHIMGQCSITQREMWPWWMVDLGTPYQIFSVVITNRVLECCKDRIIGAEIRIGSSEEYGGVLNPRCGVITSMESGESVFFSCKGMVGRYVTVQIPERNGEHLILCEVQVFGLPETSNGTPISMDTNLPGIPNGAPNVALKGVSSQSGMYNNFGHSKNSIDGSLSSNYFKIQCSQTIWGNCPWWTVDLKEVHAVFSVAVTNREDCCWERINKAEIRIGDSKEWGNNPRCAVIYSLGPGETGMFNCKGMKGKYVTVIIPGREEILSLCEVQVFGLPAPTSEAEGLS